MQEHLPSIKADDNIILREIRELKQTLHTYIKKQEEPKLKKTQRLLCSAQPQRY